MFSFSFTSPPKRRSLQRGATLTGYALTLAVMVVVALGSMKALEDNSEDFLANTGDKIGEPREPAEVAVAVVQQSYGNGNSTGGGAPPTTQPQGNPPDGVLPDVIADCLGEPGITAVELRNRSHVDFYGCDLDVNGPLDLSGFNFSEAEIRGGDWDGTIFDGGNLFRTRFEDALMDNTSFVGAVVEELYVKDFLMVGANFAGTDLTKATFDTGDLSGADFSSAYMDGAEFKEVDAGGASFAGATIINTKMQVMGALNASFAGATMQQVDMGQANVRNADFNNAVLVTVDLDDGTISDASFLGTDFDDVNLDKSTGTAQLGSTGSWTAVKCPNGDDNTPYRTCTWLP